MKLKDMALKAKTNDKLLNNLVDYLRFRKGFTYKCCLLFFSQNWNVTEQEVEEKLKEL